MQHLNFRLVKYSDDRLHCYTDNCYNTNNYYIDEWLHVWMVTFIGYIYDLWLSTSKFAVNIGYTDNFVTLMTDNFITLMTDNTDDW